jgi:hypothetical protein
MRVFGLNIFVILKVLLINVIKAQHGIKVFYGPAAEQSTKNLIIIAGVRRSIREFTID